jgi:dolichol-phosphate mannosyltransferase
MICIVIPTFDEKENIFKLSKQLLKLQPRSKIFIIDDTKMYNLKKNFKKIKNITYVNRKNKKGRGSAVLEGLKLALKNKKIKVFVEMDADFSHRPKELRKNLNIFKKKKLDLLISSRYLKSSKIYNWSIQRRIFSYLANFLTKTLLNVGVSDYTNGYRIYSKKSVQLITKYCGNIGDGFIVLSEILLQIKLNKLNIDETSTIFINRKRGKSSVNLKLIYQSFFGLIKLFLIKKKIINPYK